MIETPKQFAISVMKFITYEFFIINLILIYIVNFKCSWLTN